MTGRSVLLPRGPFDPVVLSTTAWPDEPLPTTARLVLLAAMVAAGAVVVATGVLGGRGRLRPNPLVGIRTASTLGDERVWYAVHRRAAPWVVASGAAFLAGGAALLLTGDPTAQIASVLAACALVLVLLATGTVLAHRAARKEGAGRAPE